MDDDANWEDVQEEGLTLQLQKVTHTYLSSKFQDITFFSLSVLYEMVSHSS